VLGAQSASLGSKRPLNWGPVFADRDDCDLRSEAAVISQAKNSPGMLPRFFLGKKFLGWPIRFRGQKLNSVIRHVVNPLVAIARFRKCPKASQLYRQELGKAVHR
jgi:hypothetical protein